MLSYDSSGILLQRVPKPAAQLMRIGIFGGSFDPVHYGHLILAEICRECCQLDEVRLVPAAIPPHKQGDDRAPNEQRLDMLNLAIGGNPAVVAWDAELQRGGVSYTVDTLQALRDERPDDELFFLMGADSLFDVPNWRKPEKICELATLAVVNRPGSKPVDFQILSGVTSAARIQTFEQNQLEMPLVDISSSDIRARVAGGRTIRYQTPRAVEQYIATAGLYQDG